VIVHSSAGSDEVKFVLKRLSELPTLPVALYRMLDALSDPRLSMAKISQTVSEDPALATKMLKLANSPYYGFQKEVRSVEHAMVLLGVETVKALALGVSIFNTFHDSSDLIGINKAGLWTHFLAVAFCAKQLASIARVSEPDAAFTSGLIHDIGRLALLRLFPSESVAVVEMIKDGGLSLPEAEERAFGLDHQAAGSFLARMWSLPDDLQDTIAFHHDRTALDKGDLVGAVYLAEKICKLRGLGWTGEVRVPEISDDELTQFRITSDQLEEVEKRLMEKQPEINEFFRSIW